jgi:hypothetical protein
VPFVSTFVIWLCVIWFFAETTETHLITSPAVSNYTPVASFHPECKPSDRNRDDPFLDGYVKQLNERLKVERQLKKKSGISDRVRRDLELRMVVLNLSIRLLEHDLKSRPPSQNLLYLEACAE